MRLRVLPVGLVLTTFLSCATATPENADALEVLRRIESSLLQAPELWVKVERSDPHGSFTFLEDGKEFREATTGQYVVKRGVLYWVLENDKAEVRDIPAGLVTPGVPWSADQVLADKPSGRTLIDVLRPWGVVDRLVIELQEEHIFYTTLLTTYLTDARLGHDTEGPYVICRFRVQETAYPLAKEYWNRSFFGGAEMGPPQPLTGTAEHKLWYDPVTFALRKRTTAGEFALDEGKTHLLPPLSEGYKPRTTGGKK